jgi:hypothetical protein
VKRAGVLLAALVAGCSLAQAESVNPGPTNTCASSSTCGGKAACVQGTCVATEYDLDGLLVEVRPHADASFGATTSYLFDPAKAGIALTSKDAGGAPFVARMNPTLPASVSIQQGLVRVSSDTPLEQGCTIGADLAIPASLTFYRVPPFAGLPFDPVSASTDAGNQIDVDLVPGTYDVYVEPQPIEGCNGGKPYPPAYFPGQSITTTGTMIWDMPVVGKLSGTITGFGDVVPGAWKIELVEPARGLPISANGTITKLDPPAEGYGYTAQIARADKSVPILRLTPADDPGQPTKPTGYWSLVSLSGGTQTDPVFDCSVDQLYGMPIKVTLDVVGLDGFTRVPATVTVQSTELKGTDANNAALTIDGQPTDAAGVFSAFLPPGSYDVRVTPVDNNLAITQLNFPINESSYCFCGQQFPLQPKVALSGAVKTPDGQRLPNATVSVGPSQAPVVSYWTRTHALSPLTARAVTAETTNDGNFTLYADPATADVVVQPDPSTGYPWLVRPRISPVTDTSLASLDLTSPAILGGIVRDPNGNPVANAEVNAWYAVRDPKGEGGHAGTVVKIATTSTAADGSYTLLLPSSI